MYSIDNVLMQSSLHVLSQNIYIYIYKANANDDVSSNDASSDIFSEGGRRSSINLSACSPSPSPASPTPSMLLEASPRRPPRASAVARRALSRSKLADLQEVYRKVSTSFLIVGAIDMM